MSLEAELQVDRTSDGVEFKVRVAPRARREQIVGVHSGCLKVALAAPPVEGAANRALVAFLARRIGCAKREVTIVRGESSRTKTIRVRGASG